MSHQGNSPYWSPYISYHVSMEILMLHQDNSLYLDSVKNLMLRSMCANDQLLHGHKLYGDLCITTLRRRYILVTLGWIRPLYRTTNITERSGVNSISAPCLKTNGDS